MTKAFSQDSLVEYGSRRVIITLTAIICTLLEIIDSTIVNVALNDMRGNLGEMIFSRARLSSYLSMSRCDESIVSRLEKREAEFDDDTLCYIQKI